MTLKLNASILIGLLMLGMLSGCALYDPHRGYFVSSRVQHVRLTLPGTIHQVQVLPFSYPAINAESHSRSFAPVGGGYMSVGYTYVFDEVDESNLRQSVLDSLAAVSGIQVSDSTSASAAPGSLSVSVDITRLDMDQTLTHPICLTEATIYVTDATGVRHHSNVTLKAGGAFANVSGAKNDAIRAIVGAVAAQLTQYAQTDTGVTPASS